MRAWTAASMPNSPFWSKTPTAATLGIGLVICLLRSGSLALCCAERGDGEIRLTAAIHATSKQLASDFIGRSPRQTPSTLRQFDEVDTAALAPVRRLAKQVAPDPATAHVS